jgi:acetamidase/formamidase
MRKRPGAQSTDTHCHCGWDNALEPVTTVAPGETVTLQCRDAGDGHYTAKSTAADIATMDPGRVNPVTGPVFVDGAEPGDALKVTIRDFAPSGFGWSAIIPGFGLLPTSSPIRICICGTTTGAQRRPPFSMTRRACR